MWATQTVFELKDPSYSERIAAPDLPTLPDRSSRGYGIKPLNSSVDTMRVVPSSSLKLVGIRQLEDTRKQAEETRKMRK